MRYLLFTGCNIPARLNAYELATRKIANVLRVELIDLEGANCCGLPIEGLNEKMALALSARILSLAEEQELDVVVLCNGCLSSLSKANKLLKESARLREEVNKILREVGLEFKGTREVKHVIRVLYEDIGPKKIASLVEQPLTGLRFAVQYGCHLLHPSDILLFDHPEFPSSIDNLVKCLGSESVMYRGKNRCCGSPLLAIDEKVAFSIGKRKLEGIAEAGVDGIVTACPLCHIMLEMSQLRSEKPYNLPVLAYPQLLGLALGFSSRALGLHQSRVDVSPIIEKIR